MNCVVVLGFYCWGWKHITALMLYPSTSSNTPAPSFSSIYFC
ncbi:hypothetical protein DCAR_0625904 [Daucus carota subsp. sativus]|uniref:Uncharacterized protein n=1 Tax=Daucus carota subsp. sativus TaxID=79200 RepID=A0AAF0XDW5_DAUCS|nr:hypothetical protein DCAR_0625904 [Daucus carota subsp. sativus]